MGNTSFSAFCQEIATQQVFQSQRYWLIFFNLKFLFSQACFLSDLVKNQRSKVWRWILGGWYRFFVWVSWSQCFEGVLVFDAIVSSQFGFLLFSYGSFAATMVRFHYAVLISLFEITGTSAETNIWASHSSGSKTWEIHFFWRRFIDWLILHIFFMLSV